MTFLLRELTCFHAPCSIERGYEIKTTRGIIPVHNIQVHQLLEKAKEDQHSKSCHRCLGRHMCSISGCVGVPGIIAGPRDQLTVVES